MKDSASGSVSQPSEIIRLPLVDITQMFNAPPVDPLSPAPPAVLGISGVEYVLRHLETRRHLQAETLCLALPEAKITPGLAEQSQQALRRYCQYHVQEQQALIRETRRRRWRVTTAAFLLLAFFLALSQLFASELTEGMRPLLRTTLEDGFEIIGWVMLWHPIEVLVFEPIAIKHKISALQHLMALQVVVDPAK